MIRTPTTFILSAGASAPFGFPLGKELTAQVLGNLQDRQKLQEILDSLTDDVSDVGRFADALRGSGASSVDEFLEHRPGFSGIGKACIAQALIPHENAASLEDRRNTLNWYFYLLGKMNSEFEGFGKNAVSFVTFNYDRSLDHFLYSALANRFGRSPEETVSVFRSIPIIHLHGQLGELPLPDSFYGRRYEPDVTKTALRTSRDSIRVISEAIDTSTDPQFVRARQAISSSQRICFLGFGYAEVNLVRLGFPLLAENREVCGTAVELTELEKIRIAKLFDGKITLDQTGWDSLRFLREKVDLG